MFKTFILLSSHLSQVAVNVTNKNIIDDFDGYDDDIMMMMLMMTMTMTMTMMMVMMVMMMMMMMMMMFVVVGRNRLYFQPMHVTFVRPIPTFVVLYVGVIYRS